MARVHVRSVARVAPAPASSGLRLRSGSGSSDLGDAAGAPTAIDAVDLDNLAAVMADLGLSRVGLRVSGAQAPETAPDDSGPPTRIDEVDPLDDPSLPTEEIPLDGIDDLPTVERPLDLPDATGQVEGAVLMPPGTRLSFEPDPPTVPEGNIMDTSFAPRPDGARTSRTRTLQSFPAVLLGGGSPAELDAVVHRETGVPGAGSASPPVAFEVSVDLESESFFYEDLDGHLGVLVATYRTFEPGTNVWLTIHLRGVQAFQVLTMVELLRQVEGSWPGVAMRLMTADADHFADICRFLRERPALLY